MTFAHAHMNFLHAFRANGVSVAVTDYESMYLANRYQGSKLPH